jgi:hypothetical protein
MIWILILIKTNDLRLRFAERVGIVWLIHGFVFNKRRRGACTCTGAGGSGFEECLQSVRELEATVHRRIG